MLIHNDIAQADAWLEQRSLPPLANLEDRLRHTVLQSHLRYAIPPDSGRKTALARLIGSLFRGGGESLLWIHEHGIWPSSENMELFSAYRRSLGETRSLDEAAIHLIPQPEEPALECLLDSILYFVWGAIIVHGSGHLVLNISHDEFISLNFRTAEHHDAARRTLDSFFEA